MIELSIHQSASAIVKYAAAVVVVRRSLTESIVSHTVIAQAQRTACISPRSIRVKVEFIFNKFGNLEPTLNCRGCVVSLEL